MKADLRFIEITDGKLIQKLVYLDRLVKVYGRFLSSWKSAEIIFQGRIFRIKFYSVNRYGYEHTTDGEFPIEDVDKHIALYKSKIKEEFPKRNENPRIIREKKTVTWKKYIDNAEI